MSRGKDLYGKKIGNLTILKRIPPETPGTHTHWLCRCDCGREIVVDQTNLRKQRQCKSCAGKTHGMAETPLYEAWSHMKQRCLCNTDQHYESYGGRGITVCEEWMNFEPFRDWALSNGYTSNLTLDRIDNDKGYYPENCRWATRRTQSNNRRNSLYITAKGITLPCAEWARQTSIPRNTIRGRIKAGWSPEDAVSLPVKTNR